MKPSVKPGGSPSQLEVELRVLVLRLELLARDSEVGPPAKPQPTGRTDATATPPRASPFVTHSDLAAVLIAPSTLQEGVKPRPTDQALVLCHECLGLLGRRPCAHRLPTNTRDHATRTQTSGSGHQGTEMVRKRSQQNMAPPEKPTTSTTNTVRSSSHAAGK